MIVRKFTLTVSAGCLLGTTAAFGAGGHHAVDDARTLGPGECHVESWYEHHRGREYFATVVPACNFAGLEWGLGLERFRLDDVTPEVPTVDASGTSSWGLTPQIKFARPIGSSNWSIGGIVGGSWHTEENRWDHGYIIMPISWINDPLEFHFNIGYDINRGERDDWRYGASVYRQLFGPVDGVLEVFNVADEWFGQAGLRWNVIPDAVMLDISVAQSEYRSGNRWVTLGLTFEFSR